MRNIKALLAVVSCAVILGACSSTGSLDGQSADGSAAASGVGSGAVGTKANPTSVYFDFDKYDVKSEYKPVVKKHVDAVKNDKRKIVIQGNTDERGGSEYNLALGQKRAQAVRKTMSLQGVSSKRIEVVSFGKEKPKAKGHDEASWAENRRADIVY